MELYYKYQPVTWDIGVIDASPKAVTESIQPRYIPNDELEGIHQEKKSIDEGLAALGPIGCPTKFLLVETVDKRTVLFRNSSAGVVELPTWNAAEDLGVPAYYVCNVPNTISKDHRSGTYGARILEFRKPEDPHGQEPTFRVDVINDAGKWCFYRYGDKLPFENEKAYKSRRKTYRFTEEMLVDYCQALGIPVYDRQFYSDKYIIIRRNPRPDEKGISYEEAAIKLRIGQNK